MPYLTAFGSRQKQVIPKNKQGDPIVRLDFRGLDLSSPYDVVKPNRSPFARNFRIYADEADSRKVSISSRKGPGFYTEALSSAADQQNTSTTGAADQTIGTLNWKAMKFTAGATGPLNKVELRLKTTSTASGPVVVKIYSNNSGVPGTLLAESGILNSAITSSYAYVPARFVEAPTVTNGVVYWLVAYIQDDGTDSYNWSSNTSTTLALTSNSSGSSWATTTYSLNFKTYVSSTALIKGGTRYAPESANNITVIPIGTSLYSVNDNTGALTSIVGSLSASATNYYFTYADGKIFWVNGFDNLKTWDGTTVTTITHAQLPILKLGVFHKNRFFGVSAADPNKLIWSEEPGNTDGSGNFWYNAYLSTGFAYIPTSKASDPITAIIPFQDTLYVFTRSSKYVLYGSDPGSFTLRQATGKKGAVSQNAVFADENNLYFAADDGLYRFNGAQDEIISELVQNEYESIADINDIFITKWKRQVRFYYPASGSSVNNRCLIWHTVFEEWMLDTDAYVSYAVPWTDGDDPNRLVEMSSTSPRAMYAEQGYNNLGKAIDFQYYCKNESFGLPAVRKRIPKFFPILEGDGGDYPVSIGIDKDMEDDTRYTDLDLAVGGARIGQFNVGDGTLIENVVQFKPTRVRISGFAYYWQPRIKRKAINNKVRFIGYTLSLRAKRL